MSGVLLVEDTVINMEVAATGIFVYGLSPFYTTRIQNVTVTGDAAGVYGILLGSQGTNGSPAILDSVSVTGLTTGVGVYVAEWSPEIGYGLISNCKTGIEVAAGGGVVGPANDLLSLTGCTTGLLVNQDARDITVQNLNIANPGGGIGVYTEDSITGSFSGLTITGGGTGVKAFSDAVHTLRSSHITEFTTIGVSVDYNGMIHLGENYSDPGHNSIFASGTNPPKYINSKNRLGGLGPVKAEYNWWGSDPPVSSKMGGSTVDYSPWLSANPLLSSTSMQIERAISLPRIRVLPNPSWGQVRLLLSGYQGAIDVAVFDLQGRRVNSWNLVGASQEEIIIWDGEDIRGQQSPRGVYFLRVRAADATQTVKIIRGQ